MASNKLKTTYIIGFFFFISAAANAQTFTKYWIKFIDKAGSPYSISSPTTFLSARSIQRRTNQTITIDETDIPVNQSYINQVNATGAQVFQRSKWLNAAIVIISNPTQLAAVNSLSCVVSSIPVGKLYSTTADELTPKATNSFKTNTSNTSSYLYGPSFTQISQIGVDCMHEAGYRGQNMIIGVIDDGFNQVDINPVFDSLRNEGRLLGTRDIVAGNSSVYEDDSHGAMVLSCIAGNSPNNLIGTGPKASVYLLRSEDVFSEKLIEESNWVIAAEYADSVGVDIITTSLGYTTFNNASQNHTYADLNGRTSMASIASTMAARKGIFVLNAAGNDGGNSWNYIGVPADADSICTVGAVNGSGVHAGFSSVGPTSDGRIKPDVSTMGEGTYVCSPGYIFFGGNGTSFACPIMAGAVACLWQANPTKTNMQLMQAIKATASKSSTPDNAYGWGIPNMCSAHNFLSGTTLNIKNKALEHSLTLYPNPSHHQINFSVYSTIESITLTDVLGNIVACKFIDQGNNQYRLEYNPDLSNSIYFVTIKTTDGLFNAKFIHQ